MRYYESMQDLIGHTPLVKLNHLDFGGQKEHADIYAKLELFNPAGSVKDRIGKYMIAAAEKDGRLKPGATVIEATAGNTGIGIAFAALNKGYHIIFVVPTKFSEEKQQLMKALGAEIINTPRAEGMQGAVRKANELKEQILGAVMMEQFRNPANPQAHYETTGPEIYEDLDGQIDYAVLGAGSGGTYSGVLRYLKEKNPAIKGVLADPVGSIIGGGEHGDYNIEGIKKQQHQQNCCHFQQQTFRFLSLHHISTSFFLLMDTCVKEIIARMIKKITAFACPMAYSFLVIAVL